MEFKWWYVILGGAGLFAVYYLSRGGGIGMGLPGSVPIASGPALETRSGIGHFGAIPAVTTGPTTGTIPEARAGIAHFAYTTGFQTSGRGHFY